MHDLGVYEKQKKSVAPGELWNSTKQNPPNTALLGEVQPLFVLRQGPLRNRLFLRGRREAAFLLLSAAVVM